MSTYTLYGCMRFMLAMQEKRTTIALNTATRERLRRLGHKGETYDDIINRLLSIGQEDLEAIEEAYRRIDGTPVSEYVRIDDV